MRVLKDDLEVQHSWYKRATIRKGTPVHPACNIPGGEQYWVEVPKDASIELSSWINVYGILVDASETVENDNA